MNGLRQFAVGVMVAVASGLLASGLLAEQRAKVLIKSTSDGTNQPCYVTLPDGFENRSSPTPLVVLLHTWSGDLEQRQQEFETEAVRRGWLLLMPNFRGPNQHPDACGSLKAQQDILDAVAWAKAKYNVDSRRVYLTGVSGGGHMTMLMAGRHGDVWSAASAWVGISDLAAWHGLHAEDRYGEMVRKSCGGKPGENALIDREYRQRSPITYLPRAVNVPLDIAAGIHDGHQGSVPIRHSLDAFNAIAKATDVMPVSEAEIGQLSAKNGRLKSPRKSDLAEDKSLGRKIYLRRRAAAARVTIFEGGHEGIAAAAFDWLARHSKPEASKSR